MPLGAKICKNVYSECDELLRQSCEMRKECRGDRVKEAHREKFVLAPHLSRFFVGSTSYFMTKTFYKARESTWPTMKNALF